MWMVLFYDKDYILFKKLVYYTSLENSHILFPVGATILVKGFIKQNINIFSSTF